MRLEVVRKALQGAVQPPTGLSHRAPLDAGGGSLPREEVPPRHVHSLQQGLLGLMWVGMPFGEGMVSSYAEGVGTMPNRSHESYEIHASPSRSETNELRLKPIVLVGGTRFCRACTQSRASLFRLLIRGSAWGW